MKRLRLPLLLVALAAGLYLAIVPPARREQAAAEREYAQVREQAQRLRVRLATQRRFSGDELEARARDGAAAVKALRAAALRATEIGAKAILKGTRVDGIYDRDPEKDGRAVMLPRLTYFDVLEKSLRVMDSTAITMAMEQHIPIIVFKMLEPGNMKRVVLGEAVGTIVETHGDER